jgi:hypothetical protein
MNEEITTPIPLDVLRKALSVGDGDPSTSSGGDALRAQSLDGVLKAMSFNAQHLRMWQLIHKNKTFSTVEEFIREKEYGSTDNDGFVNSGGLPVEEDTVFERAKQFVKFLGVTRRVEYPATLVNTPSQPDLMASAVRNGTKWLLGKIEKALFEGDSSVNPLAWDGINKQVEEGGGHVLDLRGEPITKEVIEEAAALIFQNYGNPERLFGNPKIFSGLSTHNYSGMQWDQPRRGMDKEQVMGAKATAMNTQAGLVTFEPSVLMGANSQGHVMPTTPHPFSGFPMPTGIIGTPPVSHPTQVFKIKESQAIWSSEQSVLVAGTYRYYVSLSWPMGETKPVNIIWYEYDEYGDEIENADFYLSDNETISFDVQAVLPPAQLYNMGVSFNLYRTDHTGHPSTAKLVSKVSPLEVPDSSVTPFNSWVDYGLDQEFSVFNMLMSDMNPESLCFKQLSPLIKIPLAITSPSEAFMLMLYGTPIVYKPKQHVLIKNVGVENWRDTAIRTTA